jgi:pimeloyl-ACP methyl ester carboxylesterase
VYVAAFAPNDGQSTLDLISSNPSPVGAQLVQNGAYFTLSRKGIFQDFAPDVAKDEKEVLWATQGPTAAAAFGAPVSSAAWKVKPTWFIIAENDRVISPELEKMEAEAMNAKSIVIPSSHVVMLSHPEVVAELVERAAH